jgi:hypothetical protein
MVLDGMVTSPSTAWLATGPENFRLLAKEALTEHVQLMTQRRDLALGRGELFLQRRNEGARGRQVLDRGVKATRMIHYPTIRSRCAECLHDDWECLASPEPNAHTCSALRAPAAVRLGMRARRITQHILFVLLALLALWALATGLTHLFRYVMKDAEF